MHSVLPLKPGVTDFFSAFLQQELSTELLIRTEAN
jgi:hypothetical protein